MQSETAFISQVLNHCKTSRKIFKKVCAFYKQDVQDGELSITDDVMMMRDLPNITKTRE